MSVRDGGIWTWIWGSTEVDERMCVRAHLLLVRPL